MSVFKKIAAKIGIGSAQVETVLDKDTYRIGDVITGKVYIKGGHTKQEIDEVNIYVMTKYVMEQDDKRIPNVSTIVSHHVVSDLTVLPKEEHEYDISFRLPLDTPVTAGGVKVWIQTGAEIEDGADSKDRDFIQVLPHPWMETVLNIIPKLGFRLRETDCEYAEYLHRRLPFVQEFEFVPTSWQHKLDEIEVVFDLEHDGMEVAIEIDRKAKRNARGVPHRMRKHFSRDETMSRMFFTKEELEGSAEALVHKLKEGIRKYSQ